MSINSPNQRKLYSTFRSAPVIITNDAGQVLDANRFQVHRDFFLITTKLGVVPSTFPVGIYEDDYVYFDGQSSKTLAFSQTFAEVPIVVLSLEDGTNQDNIIAYLTSISTTHATIGLSANYSGSVRYRAVYSEVYPCMVYDNPNNPGLSFMCTATKVDVTSSAMFTASYEPLGTAISSSFYTAYDYQNNSQVDVFLLTGSVGVSSGSGDLSAPINNRINFLALG